MKIGITGMNGKIGKQLIAELTSSNWPDASLSGGTLRNIETIHTDSEFLVTDKPEELFQISDTIIDFTAPEATRHHAELAKEYNVALIAATSGLSEEDEQALEQAAKSVPVVYASNTSVGVNVMMNLVKQAAQALPGTNWDAEIIDAHHRYKVDAPSGTSYALGKAIQEGRGESNADLVFERHGHTGPRKEGSIGFSVQRGGDNTIENTVIYFGDGERLEITHRAGDRAIFAKGAIQAALWTKNKPAGLYTMHDVLWG